MEIPLRSVLYMPGINQRAMDKARDLPCDAVVFDLEDAVVPDRKDEARDMVLAQLAGGGYGERGLVVRANGLNTPWGENDLRALGKAGVSRVCPRWTMLTSSQALSNCCHWRRRVPTT